MTDCHPTTNHYLLKGQWFLRRMLGSSKIDAGLVALAESGVKEQAW